MTTLNSPSLPPAAGGPNATARIRVAIVEDDTAVRAILRDWIDQAPGFTCVYDCGDTESALIALPEHAPEVALVDINLPGLSGIECVRRLKPCVPQTQFVMLTVYEDADHIFDALSSGATGYLLKRTPREALIAAMQEVHAGGSPMSSAIARKVVQSLQQPKPKGRPAELLSTREAEVLDLLARGHMYKEIAEAIGISLPTVNTYIRRIYEKLHVHSRAQAVAWYTDVADARKRGG
jgi:DNA-binding NarL/FixJ family response regulator